MRIYHIVTLEDWSKFSGKSYEADSLATEGFIHCSFDRQIDGVLDRYYSGFDRVIILEIDASLLTSSLVVEPSTGDEDYPHVYGPINVEAIIGSTERSLR